jgi:pteridine reductase
MNFSLCFLSFTFQNDIMSLDLNNKVALVTGATGKVTRVICLRLARAGARLALQYHGNHAQAEELKKSAEDTGIRCRIYSFDLTAHDAPPNLADNALADFGGVDLLINAASVFAFKNLAQTDDTLWQQMLNIHVTAPFRLVRALEQNFRGRESAILNFADIWGLTPRAAFLAYSVSKAALIALTKALAEELAPHTTVNTLAPGLIHFPPGFPQNLQEKVLKNIPLQRPGNPEEIADLALHILQNRYLTGQTIAIDGGRTLL